MTPLPPDYRTVEIPAERIPEVVEVDHLAFASTPDPETQALLPNRLEIGRTMAVEAPDGSLAAVHGSHAFTLPVPGGEVPCAGLTWVGTRPDQRRRGLLSSMIATHFERSIARGEPVSALFAAETAIYGRFGYGSAADDVRVKVPRGAALRDVPGSADLTVRLDTLDAERHGPLVERLHAAAGAGRPGWILRTTDPLRARVTADPPAWRKGAEALRIATVHDRAGEPRGYALFARTDDWNDAGPQGVVRVREAGAVDAAAAHRLWSFLLDLDLTVRVEAWLLPVDDDLLHLLVNPRVALPTVVDNLWVRVLDVPVALEGRRWSAPLDLVLEVADAHVPANAGRWRVRSTEQADDGTWGSSVVRTDDEADLRLDVRELSAAYLGGRSLEAYARAGLVEERRPGAARAAAVAFAWPVAPVCSWVF